MRGKKYYNFKRAPSGFLGVRGKKDNFDEQSENDLQNELYNDLQLERERLAGLLDNYLDEKEKRKPSGFVGLRGKKSVNSDDYYLMELEKRAPTGFTGVRGKKDEFPDFVGVDEKRVPISGFFGTRGKKQPSVSRTKFLENSTIKKYFKAYSRSSFFGVRKKPYMSFGKFVGVRGKKV